MLSDCAHRHVPLQGSHIIPTDSYGYTYGADRYWSDGDPGNAQGLLDQRLSGLEADYREAGSPGEVMVFVHGGLNSQGAAIDSARKIREALIKDRKTNVFPVFITWDSELFSTYFWHLRRDSNGVSDIDGTTRLDEVRVVPRVPILLSSDLASGVATAPKTFYHATGKALQNWDWVYANGPKGFPTRHRYETTLKGLGRSEESTDCEVKREAVYHAGSKEVPFELSVGKAQTTLESNASGVVGGALLPLSTTLSPIYEAIGKPAWKNMLRRSKTLIHRSPTFIRDQGQVTRADGAAMGVLRRIASWQGKNRNLKVTFVGHSMGTIVLNEAFRAMEDERDLKNGIRLRVDKVVYLAAACSIRDFNDSVGRYMQRNQNCEVYSLCLHPKREVGEKFLPAVPLVFSGSLLIWIDEFFQNPVDFQERTFGSFENCIIAAHLLPHSDRFHLKAFEENEAFDNRLRPESGPQKHGEMAEYCFWDPQFYKPVEGCTQPYYRTLDDVLKK